MDYVKRWKQVKAMQPVAQKGMDVTSPFPSDVDMHVTQFVGRWYVIVRYWESALLSNDHSGIVMMHPCKSFHDARRFISFYSR